MPLIKFFKKLLKNPHQAIDKSLEEFSIPRSQHNLSKADINSYALEVINKLHNHGHEAYLVGGSVRDLLINKVPKDFDVATSATPQQIKRLFKNSRIIGRRFKLVHITFQREIIEVSTFRSNEPDEKIETNDQGMVIRDNVYGNLAQDAWRRDFTINSLYYNIHSSSIVDYTGGFKDIQNKLINIIGQPEVRYQEDPVRMLRAIRFAAKINFNIAEGTSEPIFKLGHLLRHISNARLCDEIIKILQCQEAKQTFELLHHYQLIQYLFPLTLEVDNYYPNQQKFIANALENTDARIKAQKPTTPAFTFAVMLWFPMRHLAIELQEKDSLHPLEALEHAMGRILNQQSKTIGIPRRYTQIIREIWLLQYRFEKRVGKKPWQLMAHARFRAAYDFLLLRAINQDESLELAQWWTSFQEAGEEDQIKMVDLLNKPVANKKRRRKK